MSWLSQLVAKDYEGLGKAISRTASNVTSGYLTDKMAGRGTMVSSEENITSSVSGVARSPLLLLLIAGGVILFFILRRKK
mgnify:CR=1 FL=1